MIEKGSVVTIHYELKVEGNVVDSSKGRDPLSYTQGAGEIIPGLEAEVEQLNPGAKTSVEVPPEKGYGTPDPSAVRSVPKTVFESTDGLSAGAEVYGQQNGKTIRAKVLEVGNEDVKLDFNHPLAGKTLSFDVEVVDVAPPKAS